MGIRLKNVEMKIRKKRPENRLKKFFKNFYLLLNTHK